LDTPSYAAGSGKDKQEVRVSVYGIDYRVNGQLGRK
jgi:hypothetical protein